MRTWEYGDGAPGSEEMILDIVERCRSGSGGGGQGERGTKKRAWEAGPGRREREEGGTEEEYVY